MTRSGKCGFRALGVFTLVLAATCAWAAQDDAMPPETEAPPEAAAAQPAHAPGRPSAAHPAKQQDQDPADPPTVTVATPPVPQWPVNEQPNRAEVVWDSHGLSIQATNSSLQQILKDVSTATGASVEGLSGDERVFGFYGPGQARDVLSQLLQGAGYNVMMIGDQGQGAPRQILLTTRRTGDQGTPARASSNNNNDDDAPDNDADDQTPPPPPRPGFPGGFPRNPQQRMQQFRQEREQMLQQQQQQQQQQPNNTPQPNAPQN